MMTVSICRSCRYEQSDCKGNKSIDRTECDFFKEKLAINYPARIRELEGILEQADRSYDILLKENEALLLRADRLEAENKELKAENKELKLENSLLKEENKDLRFETVRSFERGQKFPCNLNCDNCTEKCRAWQNGYNYDRPQREIIGTKALIDSYIDKLQNCGLGKKKSLEHVGKFIASLIFEKAESEDTDCDKWRVNLVKESANDEVKTDDDEIGV